MQENIFCQAISSSPFLLLHFYHHQLVIITGVLHCWKEKIDETRRSEDSPHRRDWRNIGSEIIFNKRRNLAPISFVPSSSLYLNHVATLQLSSSFVKSRQRMLETRWKENKIFISNFSTYRQYLEYLNFPKKKEKKEKWKSNYIHHTKN